MRNYLNPWLLAASVVVAGATTLGAFNPANAITSVEELTDVNSSSWAYEALTDLVEKYDVLEGYPDKSYRGNRFATRYEMAAALDALIKAVGRDLARLGAEKANKSDLETLAALQEEFKNELAAHRARLDSLESRATAIEEKNAEQDERLDLLEKTQLHGDFSIGAMQTYSANGLGAGAGVNDTLSTVGRLRVGIDVPVYEADEEGKLGDGHVVARLVSGFGNVSAGAQYSDLSQIALGQSSANVGFGTGAANVGPGVGNTGFSTRLDTYVDLAYYKQHFRDDIPLVTDLFPGGNDNEDGLHETSADMYAGVLGWRYHFAKSPYRGDELNQFQNRSLVVNPAMLPGQLNAPGAVMAWNQGLGEHNSLSLTAGAFMPNISSAWDFFTVSEELAWHYDTNLLGGDVRRPGTLYAGGYHIFPTMGSGGVVTSTFTGRNGTAYPLGNDNVNGFYVGWNQEFWRGIGLSADWAYNEGGSNNAMLVSNTLNTTSLFNNGVLGGIRHAGTAVLTVPLTVFDQNLTKRANDVIGLGYAAIQPLRYTGDNGGAVAAGSGLEHVFEAFYRFALTDSISIVPSAQVIINRLGLPSTDTSFAAGVRANFVF